MAPGAGAEAEGDAMTAGEGRVDRAVDAAVAIATGHGVEVTQPRVLHHSNNVLVHLAPAPVVAKVAETPRRGQGTASIARELAIGHFLAGRDAPAVPPATILPAGPHTADGLELAFWRYCPHDANAELDGRAAGESLAALRDALSGYPNELPPFTAQVEHAGAILAREPLPALAAADRGFLAELHEELSVTLAATPLSVRPLHGEVHLGNLLATADGLRWIDFEDACAGPLEWDLTGLPKQALEAFPDVDQSLLELLRDVRSCCVAAWCWRSPERAPELRQAAEFHLDQLRRKHG
jgi:Phosphotransferase enzyme family